MSSKITLLFSLLLMFGMQVQAQDFETASEAVENMGVGWNMGNTLEANNQTFHDFTQDNYWGQQGLESENCWGQVTTKPELIKMMKEAGFGAIRVPVTWYNHMDKDGKVNAEWMKRVHEVVDYVIDQGLYCIINVHHDTGADGDNFKSWIKADEDNYNTNKTRFEYLWQQIADEFKDYDQHLLFESYNEMLDKLSSWCFASFAADGQYDAAVATSAYNAINSYAQSFVTTIRNSGGNNAKRNIIVNTYAACNGFGTWNAHLKDPLTTLSLPEGESEHIAVEVHGYPNIEKGLNSIKGDIDNMFSALNTNFISKGTPVIIGEWGTSNVDKGDGKTDYDVRRDEMFMFVDYWVKAAKNLGIATFYWMGLSDGIARSFPAFTQPDLAKAIVQAYYGTSVEPVLPDADDFGFSCTVDFSQQWAELNLYTKGSFTSADYVSATLELEDTPSSGLLQWKVYCSKYSSGYTSDITSAENTLTFAATMGTINSITLQCKQNSGSIRIKSIKLKRRSDGKVVFCSPSISWGCVVRDITPFSTTGINDVRFEYEKSDGSIYNLQGQRINNPQKGIYIKNRKKYMVK